MKSYLLIGLAFSFPALVHAQTAQETEPAASVFLPADFAQYAPTTALDMVSQIPGFRISGDDDDARGFGQASQNVLINGQRISSKSTTASDALSRIPAANVERIELLEAADLDIPGLSGQVVNVTAESSGISGTWSYHMRFRENLTPFYDRFDVSLTGQNKNLSWTLGLNSDPGRGGGAGRENVTDIANTLIEYGEEESTFKGTGVKGTAALAWTPDNGHIGNLNLEYGIFEANERETSNRFAPDGSMVAQRQFLFSEDEWSSEISGDYEFGLGRGRLKMIGLQRNEHSPTRAQAFGGTLDGLTRRNEIFEQTVDESESIFRLEYNWALPDKSDWQLSAEGAFNTLESEAALQRLDMGGMLAPVDIGDPTVKVEERRGEAFVTHSRQISPNIRAQASLGLEMSELTSDGVTGQVRTFNRPKGFVSTTWEPNDDLTVNLRFERNVGQLDFFDFVSSVDLNQGDDQAGNVDIVPEQSWRAQLELERDYGGWGAGTMRLFGEALEDIVDQVPIGSGEGPGNLDTGSRLGIEMEGTLKFDNIGWKGAQVELSGEYHTSSVDDPLTGESRRINGDRIHNIVAEFRHDVPNTDWAWGVTYEDFAEADVFRRRTVRRYEEGPGFMWGFVEHKDILGLTGTLFLGNLTDTDSQFTRVIYVTDRTGIVDRTEDRSRNFGPVVTLRLKGTF